MTENMKKFLETVSKSEELTKKINAMTKEDLLALAKELGIELTGADFEKPTGELSDDELDAVAGGGVCVCVVNGGGVANSIKEKQCLCILGGGGEFSDGDARCACVAGGYGEEG